MSLHRTQADQDFPIEKLNSFGIASKVPFMEPLSRVYKYWRRWIYRAALVLYVLMGSYLFWRSHDSTHDKGWKPNGAFDILPPSPSPSEEPECPSIPGLNDIHVVLKTGATEALKKLPVHSNTTLRCIPYFTIFSDYKEDIAGFHTLDVLRGVDDEIKNTHPEFELYTSLRDSGRDALSAWNVTDDKSTPVGKPNNPGWVLDKWKFLPMMHETLKARKSAKWYVFMEADTYIIWPNLLAWLGQLNANELYYLGSPVQMGPLLFAHGGSAFVLSHAALKRVTKFHSTRVKEWDEFTHQQWAGDGVLGKALQDAGVELHGSWPMLQGERPWTFDYQSTGFGKSPWCYPPVAYHHMTPDDIQAVWDFENNWRRENGNKFILHSDVFQKLVEPRFSKPGQDWDNNSPDPIKEVQSATDCAAQCADDAECFQYSYELESCRTSKSAKGGVRKPGVVSGWMAERINHKVAQLGSCKKIEWIRPH